MAQSSSVITFHRDFKAPSIQILGTGIKVAYKWLISRIREKDERCCSFLGEPLMLDWCLLLVLQIQRGVKIRLHGMIFITRLAPGEALLGKILFYHYMKNRTTIIRTISNTANARKIFIRREQIHRNVTCLMRTLLFGDYNQRC